MGATWSRPTSFIGQCWRACQRFRHRDTCVRSLIIPTSAEHSAEKIDGHNKMKPVCCLTHLISPARLGKGKRRVGGGGGGGAHPSKTGQDALRSFHGYPGPRGFLNNPPRGEG